MRRSVDASNIHNKITAFYNTGAAKVGLRNPDGTEPDGTVSEFVGEKSYAEQRQFGIDTTRDFVNAEPTLSADAKANILNQLDGLERAKPAPAQDPNSCSQESKR